MSGSRGICEHHNCLAILRASVDFHARGTPQTINLRHFIAATLLFQNKKSTDKTRTKKRPIF